MKDFVSSYLLGDLARTLLADLNDPAWSPRFSCRPLSGRTADRDTAVGRFRGDIGLPNLAEFKEALDELVVDNLVKVILDFKDATLSRSAMGALVAFAATMHGRNKRLYLYRPSQQIRARLKELQLTSFFSYLETEDDIIATLVV